jgi:hypothetical protein
MLNFEGFFIHEKDLVVTLDTEEVLVLRQKNCITLNDILEPKRCGLNIVAGVDAFVELS